MPRDLRKIFDVGNIVSILDEEEIAKIGRNATEGYEGDEESRSEWKIRNKEGMKLAIDAECCRHQKQGSSRFFHAAFAVAIKLSAVRSELLKNRLSAAKSLPPTNS